MLPSGKDFHPSVGAYFQAHSWSPFGARDQMSKLERKAGRFAYVGFAALQATPPPLSFADPPNRRSADPFLPAADPFLPPARLIFAPFGDERFNRKQSGTLCLRRLRAAPGHAPPLSLADTPNRRHADPSLPLPADTSLLTRCKRFFKKQSGTLCLRRLRDAPSYAPTIRLRRHAEPPIRRPVSPVVS